VSVVRKEEGPAGVGVDPGWPEAAVSRVPTKAASDVGLPDAEILTIREVSDYLRISRGTIYRLIERGELIGAFKLGGDWRIHRGQLFKWIESQTV